MSTILSFVSGGALMASLFNVEPATLQMIFGIMAGLAMALCAIYVYVLAQQAQPVPQRPVRRPVRRKTTLNRYPAGWPLAGAMALQGGAA